MPQVQTTTGAAAAERPMRIDPTDPRFMLLAKEIVAAWRRSRSGEEVRRG